MTLIQVITVNHVSASMTKLNYELPAPWKWVYNSLLSAAHCHYSPAALSLSPLSTLLFTPTVPAHNLQYLSCDVCTSVSPAWSDSRIHFSNMNLWRIYLHHAILCVGGDRVCLSTWFPEAGLCWSCCCAAASSMDAYVLMIRMLPAMWVILQRRLLYLETLLWMLGTITTLDLWRGPTTVPMALISRVVRKQPADFAMAEQWQTSSVSWGWNYWSLSSWMQFFVLFLTQMKVLQFGFQILSCSVEFVCFAAFLLWWFLSHAGQLLGIPFGPVFLDPTTKGKAILRGVNYASGGSGILDFTGYTFVSSKRHLQSLHFFFWVLGWSPSHSSTVHSTTDYP